MAIPMPTACHIAAVLAENQSRQQVLLRQAAKVRERRGAGHYIGQQIDDELAALQVRLDSTRRAGQWFLTGHAAANDHCGAPSAA